jgi:hypothetical protein
MSALAIPTAGLSNDATEILRRLEPLLIEIVTEQKRQGADIAALKTEVAQLRVDIIRMDKELAGITGRVSQVPNIWQIVGVCLTFCTSVLAGIAAMRHFF